MALPFYLAKRSQLPEPRRGQVEYDIFTKLTGEEWFSRHHILRDNEKKITEFDYENYFSPSLLKQNKEMTKTKEFKNMVKMLNVFSETE